MDLTDSPDISNRFDAEDIRQGAESLMSELAK